MPKVSDAHRQARRDDILAAAAACFARQGFHRTTMQDIVAQSGVSAGLVYRYFAGKDDMIAAIVAQWHDRRAALFTAPPASAAPAPSHATVEPSPTQTPLEPSPGQPSPEGLVAAYLGLLRGLGDPDTRDELGLGVQAWAEAIRSPAIRAVVVSGVDTPRALAAEAIRAAQAAGEAPATLDPDGFARMLIAIYQGLLLQTAWDPTVDHDAAVNAVATTLAATFTPPHPPNP